MSAIGGIVSFKGERAPKEWIEALTAAMHSAGPDARGAWQEQAVALGHCMLRTTPESADEIQPMVDRGRRRVLVWDGRLDNRETLLADLRAAPEGAAWPDARIVLEGYAAWGEEVAARLLGDFAFAIWDVPRQRLFCARDVIGARPFYYCRTASFFAFASCDEALLALPGMPADLDEARIAYHLIPEYQGFDPSCTWYRNVKHLRPGECMTVGPDGELRARAFRSLQVKPLAQFASDEDCAAAFLDVFTKAVDSRTRTSGDPAVMASGGIDSAAVLTIAQRTRPALHTYSAVCDDPGQSVESRCILALTSALGERAHRLHAPSLSGMLTLDDVRKVAWDAPHPVDNSVLLPALMCLAAQRGGHRVMLTGMGGDITTHSTFSYLPALFRTHGWRAGWREARQAARHHTYLQGARTSPLLARATYQAYAPVPVKRAVRRWRFRGNEAIESSLINREFARRLGIREWLRESSVDVGPFSADVSGQHLATLGPPHGLASGLGGYNRAASRFGIEIRDPWCDVRVVEFFLALPLRYKVRDGWTKYVVRQAMQSRLPAEVTSRLDKEHVGWQIIDRLMKETSAQALKCLEERGDRMDNFFCAEAVSGVASRFGADCDYDVRLRVYDLVTLICWINRHREGRS